MMIQGKRWGRKSWDSMQKEYEERGQGRHWGSMRCTRETGRIQGKGKGGAGYKEREGTGCKERRKRGQDIRKEEQDTRKEEHDVMKEEHDVMDKSGSRGGGRG